MKEQNMVFINIRLTDIIIGFYSNVLCFRRVFKTECSIELRNRTMFEFINIQPYFEQKRKKLGERWCKLYSNNL